MSSYSFVAAPDHPFRQYSERFGTAELRPAPGARTHAQYVRDGLAQERWTGPKKYAPYAKSGVYCCSPLRFLHLFDLGRDITPDMMHIIKGIWYRHIFALFNGWRDPGVPRPRNSWTDAENLDLINRSQSAKDDVQSWKLSKVV